MSDHLDAIVVHRPAELTSAPSMSLSYKGMWYFRLAASLSAPPPQVPVSEAGNNADEADIMYINSCNAYYSCKKLKRLIEQAKQF